MSKVSTVDKIHKLIHKMQGELENIDFLEFDVVCRNEEEKEFDLYKANCKYRRLNQKLRKQMTKYLEETSRSF